MDEDEDPRSELVRAAVVAAAAAGTGAAAALAGSPWLAVAHYAVLAGITALAVLVAVPRWRRAVPRGRTASTVPERRHPR